ncbi:MAG: hypothetical protein PsegKO_33050 [Pseudohongiellaceae bacterium]
MPVPPITLRSEKGAELTHDEADDNVRNADQRLTALEVLGAGAEGISHLVQQGGTVTVIGTAGSILGSFSLSTLNQTGDWEPDKDYQPYDLAQRDGSTWLCPVEHTSSSDFYADKAAGSWLPFSLRGEPGTIDWQDEWDSVTTFTVGQGCSHAGELWGALRENTNSEPAIDNSDWKRVSQISSTNRDRVLMNLVFGL